MAAQITREMPLDDVESEILYTRAALEADPDASDLLSSTDGWLGMLDAVRAKEREARTMVARASARRQVANGRLDGGCTRFGNELFLDVGKDSSAARWKRFFRGVRNTVIAFIRQPLADQVAAVKAWLDVTGDDVLDRHRDELTTWTTAATQALELTASTATARGDAQVAREQLADDLTRARDGLEAMLTERANERGLDRRWPKLFFMSRTRRAKHKGSDSTDAAGS